MTQDSTQIATLEMTLERIAKALEAIVEKLDGTNERLDSLREGLACTNAIFGRGFEPMTTKRKIALLLEYDCDQLGHSALRKVLKGLLRSFNIRCLSIRDPENTETFGSACLHPIEPKQASTTPKPQTRC